MTIPSVTLTPTMRPCKPAAGFLRLLSAAAAAFVLIWGPASGPTYSADEQTHRAPAPAARWEILAPGLELGFLSAPHPAEIGDSIIRVLRIDPGHYRFQLLNASATEKKQALTAREWCRRHGLIAAINASMYQADYLTSVSLMRTRAHVNNPRLSKDMSILAFNRLSPEVPAVHIIDRQCDDFDRLKTKYGTLVQSIRMISCTGANVWGQQPKKYSTAAIGLDSAGRVLFIHTGSLYSTHDLVVILKALPLDITRAMYAEGGPQAQMYVRLNRREYNFVGSFEMSFSDGEGATLYRPVPNVVGISVR